MNVRESERIGRELRSWMAAQGLTELSLSVLISSSSEGVSVSQSWISRICTGDFRRLGGKTGVVLRYAGIRVDPHTEPDARGREVIDAALSDVWDGSLPSAQALAGVLRSAGAVVRASRR